MACVMAADSTRQARMHMAHGGARDARHELRRHEPRGLALRTTRAPARGLRAWAVSGATLTLRMAGRISVAQAYSPLFSCCCTHDGPASLYVLVSREPPSLYCTVLAEPMHGSDRGSVPQCFRLSSLSAR